LLSASQVALSESLKHWENGIMRARFDSAKRPYRHELLPLIQERNQTTTPARCQRLREEHLLRFGCANFPERACPTENRLVKTLHARHRPRRIDARALAGPHAPRDRTLSVLLATFVANCHALGVLEPGPS